jgi:hypothetical protein
MTGILSPTVPADVLSEVLRSCGSPEISIRSVISSRAVSTSRSAYLLAGGELRPRSHAK